MKSVTTQRGTLDLHVVLLFVREAHPVHRREVCFNPHLLHSRHARLPFLDLTKT